MTTVLSMDTREDEDDSRDVATYAQLLANFRAAYERLDSLLSQNFRIADTGEHHDQRRVDGTC